MRIIRWVATCVALTLVASGIEAGGLLTSTPATAAPIDIGWSGSYSRTSVVAQSGQDYSLGSTVTSKVTVAKGGTAFSGDNTLWWEQPATYEASWAYHNLVYLPDACSLTESGSGSGTLSLTISLYGDQHLHTIVSDTTTYNPPTYPVAGTNSCTGPYSTIQTDGIGVSVSGLLSDITQTSISGLVVNDDPQTGFHEVMQWAFTRDPDIDSDGVPDASDNCVNVANLDQADANHDGIGDACTSNRPPVAVDHAITVPQNQLGQPVLDPHLIDWSPGDYDPDGDPISLQAVGAGQHGVVEQFGNIVYYTPAAGYIGPDEFTYTITDGRGGYATATIHITVEAVCDRAATNGDAKAQILGLGIPNDKLNLSMSVSWCHDGTTAYIEGTPAILAFLTNVPDPQWFVLQQALGFEVDVEDGSVSTALSLGAGGSKIVTGTAEFEVSYDAVAIITLAFGSEDALARSVTLLKRLPLALRARVERRLAIAAVAAILRFPLARTLMDLSPRLRRALIVSIGEYLDNLVQGQVPQLRFGAMIWRPSFVFRLNPDGSAQVGLTGKHGTIVVPRIDRFENHP